MDGALGPPLYSPRTHPIHDYSIELFDCRGLHLLIIPYLRFIYFVTFYCSTNVSGDRSGTVGNTSLVPTKQKTNPAARHLSLSKYWSRYTTLSENWLGHMTGTWWAHGRRMAGTWRKRDGHMVGTWRVVWHMSELTWCLFGLSWCVLELTWLYFSCRGACTITSSNTGRQAKSRAW